MQRRPIFIKTWPQFLLADDLKALGRFDAAQDQVLVDAAGNGRIAIGAFFRVQSKRIGFRPELIVVERIEPLLNIISIFKFLHVFIVPNSGFRLQEIQEKESTG